MPPDPSFHMRTGTSGEQVTGTPGNVLTFQADGSVAGEPAAGGGSFAPIQNVRYLDPAFAGTPNGSIAEPFVLFADFWAEASDPTDAVWGLMLPGGASVITPDAACPNLNNNSTLVFEGVARELAVIDLLEIDGQNGNPAFQFRHLAIQSLQLQFGNIDFDFEDCDLSLLQVAGTLNGTVRLTNCHITNALFGADGPSIEMYGGSVTGQLSFSTGKFFDVQFGVFMALTPGGTTTFVGCSFLGGTVSDDSTPIIELDPFSFASFTQNVTYTGEKRFTPSVPQVSTVRITGVNQVAGGGVGTFDFGNPESGILAEPDTVCEVQFRVNPGNVALSIMGCSVDAGTGHITVLIGNNSGGTIALADPLVLAVTYLPRFSP